jgi:hypothetical protein
MLLMLGMTILSHIIFKTDYAKLFLSRACEIECECNSKDVNHHKQWTYFRIRIEILQRLLNQEFFHLN